MRKLTCIQLQNTYKKAQPNFLQTTRKPEIILTLFITVFTISFLLLSTSSSSVEFYKLVTLCKMILLAVKLSRLDVSSTQLKQAFNFHSNHLWTTSDKKPYLRNVKKAGIKSSQHRKEICLRTVGLPTTVETPFLPFSNQFSL